MSAEAVRPSRRLTLGGMLTAALGVVAVGLLVKQMQSLSHFVDVVGSVGWRWIALGAVVSCLVYPTAAFAVRASVDGHPPLGPLTQLEVAEKFTNLFTPGGIGSTTMNVRFWKRQGVDAASAVASDVTIGVLANVAEWTLFAICLRSSAQAFHGGGLPSGWGRTALLVVLALVLVIALVAHIPKLRDKVMPHLKSAWATIAGLVRSPRRTIGVLVSGAIAPVLYALVLGCCLKAFGGETSLATLVVVNTGASTLAGISPVPGGMGVAEAGLIAGLTAAGVSTDIATATVITHRLITFWIPPVAGWLALRDLRRRQLV